MGYSLIYLPITTHQCVYQFIIPYLSTIVMHHAYNSRNEIFLKRNPTPHYISTLYLNIISQHYYSTLYLNIISQHYIYTLYHRIIFPHYISTSSIYYTLLLHLIYLLHIITSPHLFTTHYYFTL